MKHHRESMLHDACGMWDVGDNVNDDGTVSCELRATTAEL